PPPPPPAGYGSALPPPRGVPRWSCRRAAPRTASRCPPPATPSLHRDGRAPRAGDRHPGDRRGSWRMSFREQALPQICEPAVDKVLRPLDRPAEEPGRLRNGMALQVQHHRQPAIAHHREQTRSPGCADLTNRAVLFGLGPPRWRGDRVTLAPFRVVPLQSHFPAALAPPDLVHERTVCDPMEVERREDPGSLTCARDGHDLHQRALNEVVRVIAEALR